MLYVYYKCYAMYTTHIMYIHILYIYTLQIQTTIVRLTGSSTAQTQHRLTPQAPPLPKHVYLAAFGSGGGFRIAELIKIRNVLLQLL